jgi:hypothetical protein
MDEEVEKILKAISLLNVDRLQLLEDELEVLEQEAEQQLRSRLN